MVYEIKVFWLMKYGLYAFNAWLRSSSIHRPFQAENHPIGISVLHTPYSLGEKCAFNELGLVYLSFYSISLLALNYFKLLYI